MANGEDLDIETLLDYVYGTPNPSEQDIRFREDVANGLEGQTPSTRSFEDYDMSDGSISLSGPDVILFEIDIDGNTPNLNISGNDGTVVESQLFGTTQRVNFSKSAVEGMKFADGFPERDSNFEWDVGSLDHTQANFGSDPQDAGKSFNPEPNSRSEGNLSVEYSDGFGVKDTNPISASKPITFGSVSASANSSPNEIADPGFGDDDDDIGDPAAPVSADFNCTLSVLWNFNDILVGSDTAFVDEASVTATVEDVNNANSGAVPASFPIGGNVSGGNDSLTTTITVSYAEGNQPSYSNITSFTFEADIKSSFGGGSISFSL